MIKKDYFPSILMYGAAPPDPSYPRVEPWTPLPDLTDMTTLTRLYNLEQEVNRLNMILTELSKKLDLLAPVETETKVSNVEIMVDGKEVDPARIVKVKKRAKKVDKKVTKVTKR